MNYEAPLWLPGGNLQTIWPALAARAGSGQLPQYRRERWTTPDADFIDVDWLRPDPPGAPARQPGPATPGAPARTADGGVLLVLFHGLEGSSASHYARAFADFARQRDLAFAVAHFRGCSGEINLGPRAYHSGDHQEIDWILKRFRRSHAGPIVALGVSLGGNALLRWAGEMGSAASTVVRAVASVCAPIDLAAGGHAIGRGFNRLVYTRMFLNTMKPKALRKLAQHPGLFDPQALAAARDLYTFDAVFTAPLHGFRSTEDYWERASAKPHLHRVGVPALVVNARNDPFVPAWSLPQQEAVGRFVELWQPDQGGHVGFPRDRWSPQLRSVPQTVGDWLLERAGAPP